MKYILLCFLLSTAWAENNRFNLPIYIGDDGKITVLSKGQADFTLNPIFQIDLEKSSTAFILPRQSNAFALRLARSPSSMIQIDHIKKEIGLGLRLRGPVRLGLVPFRGSVQTTTRVRHSATPLPMIKELPSSLHTVENWSIGDESSHQTYGGIAVTAGIGVFEGINLSAGLEISNIFTVALRKDSPTDVTVTLTEENDLDRTVKIGTDGIGLTAGRLRGRVLTMEFGFNLQNARHQDLYQMILAGKVTDVQRSLPWKEQRMQFVEAKKKLTIGITQVAAETRTWSHFRYPNAETYLKVKRSRGLLVKSRNHQQFAISDDKGIVLMWTSKMKKVDGEAFRKHFLERAERLKLKNFDLNIYRNEKIGTIQLSMGIAITREQLTGLSLVEGNWKSSRTALAQRLLLNPSFLDQVLSDLPGEEKVYFKFLSKTHESLEGETVTQL